MLADAVRKAFPSLQIGETEVTHLLCRVQYIHAVRLTKVLLAIVVKKLESTYGRTL